MASADLSSPPADVEGSMSAGEFVLKKLFAEFVVISDEKLQAIASEPPDFLLAKALQKGEDAHFDQLLCALNEVASFCLRSILTSIFKWRDMQIQQCRSHTSWSSIPPGDMTDSSSFSVSKREKDYLTERQELAIDFIFCLVLIEVLTKLSVHPVPESFIHTIEDYAFKHFKQQEALKDRTNTNPNIQSMKKIADLYAEVIGVLSQSRFHSVRRRFFTEIRDSQNNSSTVISIIEGMSFIRVKMFPVEELEQWFAFLQECASFFLETNREKIKHAMCALLVEILLPVAAVIKFEASIPVIRKFVTILYNHCFESAKRGKHSTAYIPLVTVLLAISEQQFFLNHWSNFLIQIIMHNIRRGDSKVQRTALESLNRLIWVYMVRIKGESNTATVKCLKMILEVLFPRGQRGVQPKDMPLNIFVKLIQFISRERLEFGMSEILELLNQGRTKTTINPERMNIALRAFLVIADSLEKKEGDPPMPLNIGPLPSGGPQRVKTKYLSTTLTDETAKKIGIKDFYPKIRSALDGMLRALDPSVGKPFISTNIQNMSRSEEEILGPVKAKLDLLKTCVAAIPRIMPADMTRDDLIDLLSRLTIHMDHELVRTSFNSLQNIITNFPGWRHHVTKIFALFILRDIPDSCPLVLEAGLKMLIQMITHWKSLLGSEPQSPSKNSPASPPKQVQKTSTPKAGASSSVSLSSPGGQGDRTTGPGDQGGDEGGEMYYCLPWVEACGLVTMCSYRSVTRRLSLVLLKEIRSLHMALQIKSEQATCTVMDVIDKAMPNIIKRYLATLTFKERSELRLAHQNLNIYWMADRTSCFLEQGGSRDGLRDAWAQCVAGLLEPHLLPEVCPTSVHIAWPYAYHRMYKAYAVLDPGFVAHDKGDRPPSLKGRRPVMSTVEMFLWRNYLIFLSCTAPPSTSLQASLMSSGDSTVLEGSGRNQLELNARNLFHKVVPFIRMDGEIREVAISALGMVHPNAFGDLVEELYVVIHDALDQRKGDNPRKKRRRETLRVQITRVFALTAEHGCFQQSPMTRTEKGDVTTVFLEFIDGIRNCLEAENDRMMTYLQDLRLFFAMFISNIINSLPQGKDQSRLFSQEMRYSLFQIFSNWCGLYGLMLSDSDQEARRNSRHNALSFNALQAMSALLCCGPVFHHKCLEKDFGMYRWLENMLSSDEPKVQTLGRKTVQMLLQNNVDSTLLAWVIDHCYGSKPVCAQLCFHALCNTLASNPKYPCDMITILHVVLYKTADTEYNTRERAIHLLQILDRRYFATNSDNMDSRSELLGCLKGGAYSQNHVSLSKELALANPELTLPMFCEMVLRFEMSSPSGKRSLLQYMVPWLQNVELVEDAPASQPPGIVVQPSEHVPEPVVESIGNSVLTGSGWGSPEGTKVVLHNLLYITTKYGDEYSKEVENLWCALCTWMRNIRVTINYLARLTHVVGNVSLMLQQAKRIVVCFSRSQALCIVHELINDLNFVELISSDVSASEQPPYYLLTSPPGTRRYDRTPRDTTQADSASEEVGGATWAITWRVLVHKCEGNPVPLPVPKAKLYFAGFRDMFKLRSQHQQQQQAPLHKCNFALILLSELVIELQDYDWSLYLPLLLHTILLGLDLYRPLVYEHSKKLLGSLIVVLACRNDKIAALQARFVQQEVCLRSPSFYSLSGDNDHAHIFSTKLHSFSDDSLHPSSELFQSSLSSEAKELVHFVSTRESHRAPWPFTDMNTNRSSPNGDVGELSSMVGKMLAVFRQENALELKEKWADIALRWATSCSSHKYASHSFQVCRALQLPLSSTMFREVLTRLAESASEEKEDMQSYVLEIVLTLESAVDNMQQEGEEPVQSSNTFQFPATTPQPQSQQQQQQQQLIQPSQSLPPGTRKQSDLPPLQNEIADGSISFSPSTSDQFVGRPNGGVIKPRHSRGRSVTSRAEMMSRPNSAKARVDSSSSQPPPREHRPTSPPAITSPTHHKSPTVTGTHVGLEKDSKVHVPVRPHSTIIQGYLPSHVILENPLSAAASDTNGKTIPNSSQVDMVQLSPAATSPLKTSVDTLLVDNTGSITQASVVPDGGAAPPSSASAPDTKPPREIKETKVLKESLSSSAAMISTDQTEREVPVRKGSEPPPSLQVIFSRENVASSRRWQNKQFTASELNAHFKQHSFDSSNLQSPQSPKVRRVKSPSVSDKNTRSGSAMGDGEGESTKNKKDSSNLHRTPSHPHLNSATSSPQVFRGANLFMEGSQPIARARSTQQLKLEEAGDSETPQLLEVTRSSSKSNVDLAHCSETTVGVPSGLKLYRDREISQSKESLDNAKDTFGLVMKKAVSRESLKGKEPSSFPKVIQSPLAKDLNIATTCSSVSMAAIRDMNKENRERSAPLKDTQSSAEGSVESMQASQQGSPPKQSDIWHRASLQVTQKYDVTAAFTGKKTRPSSMIEMPSYCAHRSTSFQAEINPGPPELLAQLFWTGASLLESDYPGEYSMALRLLAKVFDHLDLTLNDTCVCLEKLLSKMDWGSFPGVQSLLLKGLTHDVTSEPTRELLSRVTLFSTRAVFDPSQYAGLPMNIMALMPVLIHHFNQPTPFCIKVVSNIQQACTSVDLPSEECKTKMGHMSKMFQMYATKEFINGCDLWLAGICRYLNDAYTSLAVKILLLLAEMLEKGSPSYHQPVLKLLYEYMKLQNPNSVGMKKVADTVMTVATQHIKGHLWKEALALLRLAVSNSASLVQPPTRGLPVDLGLFNQTLPGPTLQFTMDLHHGSLDLELADAPIISSSWKQPQASQRRTRERLVSVLNACGPGLGLMSSPSVVFTDDQALLADKGTLYSSASEEAASSIASVNHDEIIETSQPESQNYINAIGEQFNFLDNLDYMYKDSSSESETPGPFSRSFQVLDQNEDQETEEREEDRDSSPLGSLAGSRISLVEATEDDESYKGTHSPTYIVTPEPLDSNASPEKSPDTGKKPRDIRMLSPERSPIVIRRYTRSPEVLGRRPYDMKLRSPDLRVRGLEGFSQGLPDLKEGSSTEDLETPKQSPERDFQGEGTTSNTERSEYASGQSTPEVKSKLGRSSPIGSQSRGSSREVSPDDRAQPLPTGDQVVRSEDASIERGTSPQPVSDIESSYELGSKLSENTISAHSSEDIVESHMKSASKDSSTAGTHLKAASDDVTAASHISKLKAAISRTESQSLNAMDRVGIVDTRILTGIMSSDNGEFDGGESGKFHAHSKKERGGILSSPVLEMLVDKEAAEVVKEPILEETVISPTLRIAKNEDVKRSMLDEPEPVASEETLFEMLKDQQDHSQSDQVVKTDKDTKDHEEAKHSVEAGPEGDSIQQKDSTELSTEPSGAGQEEEMMHEMSLSSDEVIKEEVKEIGESKDLMNLPSLEEESAELTSLEVKMPPDNTPEVGSHDQDAYEESHDLRTDIQRSESPERPEGDLREQEQGIRSPDVKLSDQPDESDQQQSHDHPGESHDQQHGLKRETSEGGDSVQLREDESPLETSSEWLVVEASTQQEPEASKFINFDIDEIEDIWQNHVTKLSQRMSAKKAVNTYFLFGRLFGMIQSQFCQLTREACSYLGEDYKTIASHFLVTTELLLSQFQLPKVYIDAEMIKRANILEQHVFVVLELQETLATYLDKRKAVLKSLSEFKLALRQQSDDSPSPSDGALGLCRAVHKFHFQLLVLLGSYVKLISILEQPMEKNNPMSDSRDELTDLIQGCGEALVSLSRGSPPPLDDNSYNEVEQHSLSSAVRTFEDLLSQRHYLKAVQLLHTVRKQWKGEEVLGTAEDDDIDCLFFIYARYVADRQEGTLCITKTEQKLSEVHGKLMAQNISLHSLLEQTRISHDKSHGDTSRTKR